MTFSLPGVRAFNAILLTGALSVLVACGGSDDDGGGDKASALLDSFTPTGLQLDQTFQPTQKSYTATVGFLVSDVSFKASTATAGASITINGQTVSPNTPVTISLAEGDNLITTNVTANGDTTPYTLTVTREAASDFAQQQFIKASDAASGNRFGHSVAIEGDLMAVGAFAPAAVGAARASNEDAVYLFERNNGVWEQQTTLTASNSEANDNFGASVAISGDTIVVGATREDSGNSNDESDNSVDNSGAAYVFTRSGTSWSQQAYLKANTPTTLFEFGSQVAIDGDTILVGEFRNSGGGTQAGAAYVFTRSGTTWSEPHKLTRSSPADSDNFGYSLAVSGDTLLVGAYGANVNGEVYVYTPTGTTWALQATLTDASGSFFGAAVDIDGDTAVIGDTRYNSFQGAAFVFTRSGTTWSLQQKLTASNAGPSDTFGFSVGISGGSIIVGATGEDNSTASLATDNNSAANVGAVYVFTRSGTTWSQTKYIKASTIDPSGFGSSGDVFGEAVAISGDTLVVGSPYEDSSAGGGETDNSTSNAGAAYVWQ